MQKKWRIVIPCVLILLLLVGIVCCKKAEKSAIHIQIGVPVSFDEAGSPSAIYYDTDINRKDTEIVLLAMVNALPLPQEEYPTGPCDAMIVVRYQEVGYPYQVWFTEDSIIYGNKGPDREFYKEFHNDHTEVVSLIQNSAKIIKNNQK